MGGGGGRLASLNAIASTMLAIDNYNEGFNFQGVGACVIFSYTFKVPLDQVPEPSYQEKTIFLVR